MSIYSYYNRRRRPANAVDTYQNEILIGESIARVLVKVRSNEFSVDHVEAKALNKHFYG